MEEIIHLRDFGETDYKENAETEDIVSNEFVYKKNLRLGDIIIVQLILCVVIVIALIICNRIKPDLTQDILDNCRAQINKPSEYKDEVISLFNKVVKIINDKI